MKWKKKTDLKDLGKSGNVLVMYDDGSCCTEKVSDIREGLIEFTHWTVFEPPVTDYEAFLSWYNQTTKKERAPVQIWNAALAWERLEK